MDESVIPLSNLNEKKKGKIVEITGGHHVKRRLHVMGIHTGKTIKMKTKQPFCGPLTIEVCGTQMTIGRGIASKIQVKLIE